MPGDQANIRVWETGDVFIFDPDIVFVSGTHVPTDIDADLHVAWLPAGLMKGDPGVEMPREIDKTDVPSWQQGRVLTRYKNAKVDANFNLLEDNEATEILVSPEDVPRPVKTHIALEFVTDDGFKERRISRKPAHIWIPNDNKQEDVNGRDVQCSLYPDGRKLWTIQEGIPV
jgi:hypothetical protein